MKMKYSPLGRTGAKVSELCLGCITELDEVAAPGRAIVPCYEADFGPHSHSW